MNKEQLISQNQWDLFRNKPYENYTVQATQHTTLNRIIQAMDDMETNERSLRQSQAGRGTQHQDTARDNTKKHQIAYDYVCALKHQIAAEQALESAFASLGSESPNLHTAGIIGTSYLRLVQSLIGEHLTDWLDWWMWEANFGERNLVFTVNNTSYDPSQITLYKFLELVDER